MKEAFDCPEPRLEALALALAAGVGARKYADHVARFGTAAQAFASTIPDGERAALLEQARSMLADADRAGARLLLLGDEDYPSALRDLGDPPPFLFIVGEIALLERPCVAIVGTRRATPYGERTAALLARAVAGAGGCVVSGMASGIDGAAHRGALEARGATAAVLGTGVDVAYPHAHRRLHRAIRDSGVLISEFPCGARALPGSFPRRNRIIAALARLTIVVEAGERSGARITADHALDLGRDVGAVPGPIDAPQSVRSNAMLRDGAQVITCARDVLDLAGLAGKRRAAPPTLQGDELLLWAALGEGAATLEALGEHTGLSPRTLLATVTALEVAGVVEMSLTGEIRRRDSVTFEVVAAPR